MITVKIKQIKIENRFRKDFGDLQVLADSIKELGLLQPICISGGYTLIAGERRIRAHKLLGLDSIEARIVHLENIVSGEYAENEVRKDFTVSERVAILEAIDKKPVGGDFDQWQNFATANNAAKQAGLGNKETARQAKAVVSEGAPELIEKMDSGEVSISAAAVVATFEDTEQQEIIEEINEGGKPTEVIKKHVLATKHTGDEESYTPEIYINSVLRVMGEINLDPASNDQAQKTVKADKYYTLDDDGLTQQWEGKTWMNPPYTARVINKFIDKIVSHYMAGDIPEAIILTNNNTDTSWFHDGAEYAGAICFTKGRINFLKRDGSRSSPTNGQSFLYFGENTDKFKNEFSKHGLVMVKA